MKGRYVIAHDVGTSSTKAVLIDVNGNILETATVEYGFHYPKPGWVEQSPEDYWKATVESTKKIMSSSRVDPSEILGIVYTTQAMGIIPVSKNGKILMKNITWVDGRAEKQAIKLMYQVFDTSPALWRGMGKVPDSGLKLRPEYQRFDAELAFAIDPGPNIEPAGCICGDILRGIKTPADCHLFGNACTPESPVGPCMISLEGSCAAYYLYGGHLDG